MDRQGEGPSEDVRSAAEAMSDAKRPATPFAGLYGRPLHPLAASIATGAWVCSFGFDLVSQVANDPGVYTRGAYFLVITGIAFGLLAATLGLLDVLALPRGTPVFREGIRHLVAADVAVLVFLLSFLLRRWWIFLETPWTLVAVSAVGLLALSWSSWSGLGLSYRWGVRVVDEADQLPGYERSSAPTSEPVAADGEPDATEAPEPMDDDAPEDGDDVDVATHRT